MPSLDDARLRWAVAAAAPGADIVEVRGLRDGGSPWLLRLSLDGRERGVVLRVGRDPAPAPANRPDHTLLDATPDTLAPLGPLPDDARLHGSTDCLPP